VTGPVGAQAYRWRVVLLFLVCSILAYVDRNVTGVLVESLKASLHLSDTQIGFIQGFAFSLCFAFAGPPIAWLIDRGPRMRIAASGIAIWSLATAVCGVSSTFSALAAGRALTATAEAALPPSVYSMITDMFPRNQVARATALFLVAPSIGLAVAWFAGGLLLSKFVTMGGLTLPLLGHVLPWQAVFLTLGAPGLILSGALACVQEPRRREPPAGATLVTGQGLPTLAQVFAPRARVLVPYVFGTATLMTGFFAHTAWAISVLARNHGLNPHAGAPLMGALTLIAGCSGALLSAWLAGRGSEADTTGRVLKIMIASGLLMAAAAFALPFTGSGWPPVAVLGFFLFASTAGTVLLAVPMQLAFPGHVRARAITIVGLFYAIGSAGIGPWLVGWVNDHVFHNEARLGVAVAAVSVVAAVTGVCFLACSLARWRDYGGDVGVQ
jgi:MFS family permease